MPPSASAIPARRPDLYVDGEWPRLRPVFPRVPCPTPLPLPDSSLTPARTPGWSAPGSTFRTRRRRGAEPSGGVPFTQPSQRVGTLELDDPFGTRPAPTV